MFAPGRNLNPSSYSTHQQQKSVKSTTKATSTTGSHQSLSLRTRSGHYYELGAGDHPDGNGNNDGDGDGDGGGDGDRNKNRNESDIGRNNGHQPASTERSIPCTLCAKQLDPKTGHQCQTCLRKGYTYHLCSTCFLNVSLLHPEHTFVLGPMPTADRPTEENATPHTSPSREQMPFTPCHACERAIRGTRYQCQICGDVNFCRGCCDFHPSDHLLEILPCSPSDGDSPRLSSGSDLGSRVNYDLNEAPYAETDSDDPEEDDDDDDDDYRDSNSDEDQGHDSGAQNTSLSMTRGAAHLGTWSSLIAAPRPPSEAVPPIPQLNLTDRQFAKYMRTAERLWTESTAQIRELQRNGPFPIPHRRQRIDGDNEVVGRQRRSTPHRRWRPEDLERLRALKEQGTPDTEIARILDRSASAIRQQWRKLQE